jgi:hypothetical protein
MFYDVLRRRDSSGSGINTGLAVATAEVCEALHYDCCSLRCKRKRRSRDHTRHL